MAVAISSGRPHRAKAEIALHALDTQQAVHAASDFGRHIELTSTCERPAPAHARLMEWEPLDP